MSDPEEIRQAKARIRRDVEAALARLTPDQRVAAGLSLCQLMSSKEFWTRAKSVLCFAPMPGEIDIWPLVTQALERGKSVALPRYDRAARAYSVCYIKDLQADLVSGFFGIREPAAHCLPPPSKLLDLILVPGVAFDTYGRRLGRGKGFYDRLLTAWGGLTCGVCYDEQVVDHIPVEPHDVQLHCILTPTRFFHPRRS